MDEALSLSNSREEGFQDMVDDSIDDCIVVDALYLVFVIPKSYHHHVIRHLTYLLALNPSSWSEH